MLFAELTVLPAASRMHEYTVCADEGLPVPASVNGAVGGEPVRFCHCAAVSCAHCCGVLEVKYCVASALTVNLSVPPATLVAAGFVCPDTSRSVVSVGGTVSSVTVALA